MGLNWGADRVVLLMHRWASADISAYEIGQELMRRNGEPFTKNAVIGKANRLGLRKGEPINGDAIKRVADLMRERPKARDFEIRAIIAEFGAPIIEELPPKPVKADRAEAKAEAEADDKPEALQRHGAKLARAMERRLDDLLPKSQGKHRHIWELSPSECRFPVGRDGGFHVFCGGAVKEGSAYCCEHHRKCWKPAPDPTKKKKRRIVFERVSLRF